MCVCARSLWTLCNPMNCSPPGSSATGFFQARILEWVAISSSRGSSQPRDWTCISCIGRQILYHWATWVRNMSLIGTCQGFCNICVFRNMKLVNEPRKRTCSLEIPQVLFSWPEIVICIPAALAARNHGPIHNCKTATDHNSNNSSPIVLQNS